MKPVYEIAWNRIVEGVSHNEDMLFSSVKDLTGLGDEVISKMIYFGKYALTINSQEKTMKLPIDDQIDVWISKAEKSGDLRLLMDILDAKSIVIFKMLEQLETKNESC